MYCNYGYCVYCVKNKLKQNSNLIHILLTILVTAVTTEGSFSKLKILKYYLRSNISQE